MKKILSFLLVTVFILCFLVSCNDTDTQVSDTVSDDVSACIYGPDVPDINYGGETVVFLTCGITQTANSEILYNEYGPDSENQIAEVVNLALRERYFVIEEQLGVKIEEKYIHDAMRKAGAMIQYIRDDLSTGTHSFDVAVPSLYDCATLAAEGVLADLTKDVPYLNLKQPWWDQSFNEEMTLGGSLYFTIGDIGIINKDATPCIAFNKDLITEYGLENPYELVDEGKWTVDKVIEMAKTVKNDLNQDGVINYKDQFGYGGQYDDMWYMFYGSGERTATIGTDGWPEITVYTERSTGVVENILELLQNKDYYVSANDYFGEAQYPVEQLVLPAFVEGRTIFNLSSVSHTGYYREMEDDFGLLPIPKYDQEQDRHYTLVNPWTSNAFCVPLGLPKSDYEKIGITLEVMGAFSKNELAPAYYEIALKNQRTRDEDTSRMLDIIFSTRGCDIGMLYKWGGVDTMLQSLITKPAGSFTSTYDAMKGKMQADLDETVSFYKGEK